MPFKSKAQRRKFAQLLVEGKISDEVYEEWNRSTGRKALPERVHPKAAASANRTRTRARPTTAASVGQRRTTGPSRRRKPSARPRVKR